MLAFTKREVVQLAAASDDDEAVPVHFEAGHITAYSLGGPNLFVQLIPFDSECNGLMARDHAFEWIARHSAHWVTATPEFLEAKRQHAEWFREWVASGRPDVQHDPDNPALIVPARE